MNPIRQRGRRSVRCSLEVEGLERRRLLSASDRISPLLVQPAAYTASRPNLPVMPFTTPTKKASFLDPTVTIGNGLSVVLSYQSYVAPYAALNAQGGAAIKIGTGSNVLDNAVIVAHPGPHVRAPEVLIGDQVSIGYGAKVVGPSTIGGYGTAAKPTEIGARAVIDGATIEPGAIVSPLARVGPGVTVPSGYRVLPGMDVTTDAESSNPKLGRVVPVTSSDLSLLKLNLSESQGLAAGYTNLYQGSSATGTSPGANPAIGGVYNGNLSTVEGASLSPGPSYVSGTKKTGPEFPTPHQGLIGSLLSNFPARVIGLVVFNQRAWQVGLHLGRANSIRNDEGLLIQIGSIAHTGRFVTINAPLGSTLTIGQDFRAGAHAVILGGPFVKAKLGDHVRIGAGAVLDGSSLGSDSTVGPNAYLLSSTFPAHTVIPSGAIYVNNQLQGYVQS